MGTQVQLARLLTKVCVIPSVMDVLVIILMSVSSVEQTHIETFKDIVFAQRNGLDPTVRTTEE